MDRSVVLGERFTVRLSRRFSVAPEELWDAIANPERLARWFLPVRLEGERFQLEGNAGGSILACDAPSRLALTWEFGGDQSRVEIEITSDGRLTLSHVQNPSEHWDRYGPGAVGVGWELSFRELAVHLGEELPETDARESAAGWGEAAVAAGADPGAARTAAGRTGEFYSG